MIGVLRQCVDLLRTSAYHVLRISDRKKWQRYEFNKDWTLRLKRIAELVPDGSSVFEFGAGPIGLRPFLNTSCALFSSDIVPREHAWRVIDLNRIPLPDLTGLRTDVAVFSGVLEYVSELRPVVEWAANYFKTCIATYECAYPAPNRLDRVRQVVGRINMGWVNHLTESEFLEMFSRAGFRLAERVRWGSVDPGMVYVFHMSG